MTNPYKHIVFMKCIRDIAVKRASFASVGVKADFILLICTRPQQRKCHAARWVILNIIALKIGITVFASEHCYPFFDAFSVAVKRQIADNIDIFCFLVVFGELQSVVADYIYRIAVHLTEYPLCLPGARHNQFVFFTELVKRGLYFPATAAPCAV